MLTTLAVKNYVLIDELTIELAPGLNVFTGETGAGKSIIVDAAGFLVGEKMSSSLVRDGSSSCSITGVFSLPPSSAAARLLSERGYMSGSVDGARGREEVVIRRELDLSARTRCYINDRPSTAAFLKELGARLIDIHGQHEHQTLLDPAFQREFLDSAAGVSRELKSYASAREKVAAIAARLASLEMDIKEKARLTELCEYQIKDIDSAALSVGDEERIAETLPQMKNAEKLKTAAAEIKNLLDSGDDSLYSRAARLARELKKAADMGAPFAGDISVLDGIMSSLDGINENAADFLDKTASFDAGKLDELIAKLDKIERLKKKYGSTIEEILEYRRATAEKLEALKTGDETRTDLENEMASELKKLQSAASAVSAKRKISAADIVSKVAGELKTLGLSKSVFEIRLEACPLPPRQWPAHGADTIEFYFSANKGERPRRLKDIISGGEMSRFMLALKTAGSSRGGDAPVMIFDEIDAGLSGPAAQTVGAKLGALSRTSQTIVITHMPQIAAFAARHFLVEKSEVAGRTLTGVRRLGQNDIRPEIARMLSGRKVTDTALRHADELLRQAKSAGAK